MRLAKFTIVGLTILLLQGILLSCETPQVYFMDDWNKDSEATGFPIYSIELAKDGVLHYSGRSNSDSPIIRDESGKIISLRNHTGKWKDSSDMILLYFPDINDGNCIGFEYSIHRDTLKPTSNNMYRNTIFIKSRD